MLAKWAEIPVAESLLPDMRRNEFWGNGRLQNRTRFKLLLCLLSTLHEHTGVLITAVLEFVDWSRELGDAKMTLALLDKLPHYCLFMKSRYEALHSRHSSAEASGRFWLGWALRKGG
jgi:hypothetical protein